MALGSGSRVTAVAAVTLFSAGVYLSVSTSAFTSAQADRGLLGYERSCSKCHQSDLQGSQESEAPALVGDTFSSHWGGQPIKELFDKVSTKMPADKPATLSANAYLDIVAYLLHANKFPAGNDELDLKPESLMRIIDVPPLR